MKIDKSKLTAEMIKKAKDCKTPEELIALAKDNGIDITREEAESYLAELDNVELDSKVLDKVAGGTGRYDQCPEYGQACPGYINVG